MAHTVIFLALKASLLVAGDTKLNLNKEIRP